MTVPTTPKPGSKLALALSEGGFAKLVAEYGGETLDLPKGDAYLRQLRYVQVRACRDQGMTVDDTAHATGYSRRHILNIRGGHADHRDPFTRDMFDPAPAPAPAPAPRSFAGSANDPFGIGARG